MAVTQPNTQRAVDNFYTRRHVALHQSLPRVTRLAELASARVISLLSLKIYTANQLNSALTTISILVLNIRRFDRAPLGCRADAQTDG